MSLPEIHIERLATYTPEDAADLGVLRKQMSSKRSDSPISEKDVRDIVDHEDRLWVAARSTETGRIVGCETLTTNPAAELEGDERPSLATLGFVATHSDVRGQGIFKLVTMEGFRWCQERGIEDLLFTSNPVNAERATARGLYLKYGAVIVANDFGCKKTDLFTWNVQTGIEALGN